MKIYVAGHRGMVGSSIVRALNDRIIKGENLELIVKTHSELDLKNQSAVRDFFNEYSPDVVIIAAAKVGGVHANNSYPAEFIYDNLMIQTNLVHEAWMVGVKKLLFLGSSCIYPRLATQPMKEDALLTGKLEPTNEPYAVAKIAGIKICESYNRQYGVDYRSVMPTNLYGPGDNFNSKNSHVVPALIKRFHEAVNSNAPVVMIWGSGKPFREFMHVDDMASGALFVLDLPPEVYGARTELLTSHINIGSQEELTIEDLALAISEVVGFKGAVKFDPTKPDGAPRKLMDSSRIRELGWTPSINLIDGLKRTYADFVKSLPG